MKIDGVVNCNLLFLFLQYGCELWFQFLKSVISVSGQCLWIVIVILDWVFNFWYWATPFNTLLNGVDPFTNLMGTWNLKGSGLKFYPWLCVRVWFFTRTNFIVGRVFAPIEPDPLPSLHTGAVERMLVTWAALKEEVVERWHMRECRA
jgi:hypothetical protein